MQVGTSTTYIRFITFHHWQMFHFQWVLKIHNEYIEAVTYEVPIIYWVKWHRHRMHRTMCRLMGIEPLQEKEYE